ncbi:MAG: hypothetical protein KAY61_04170 [Candidatus Eisenbacteria bacterium]|jgi:hypothetical protein|nr:hypothetical protein [Candidatus Eisenbacteria bacterium]MBP8137378.1 hypothetical protein [Candidatus Eisenbacteria bacterium]
MPLLKPRSSGLCDRCAHVKHVLTPRSEFLLCERSKLDPAYPRYPRLPVLSCPGFEPAGNEEAPAGEDPDQGSKG